MKNAILILILVAVLVSSGCVSQSEGSKTSNPEQEVAAYSGSVEKVEVYHFHVTRQCQGCINIGKCAEDTVNEYFENEQDSGILVFAHVNVELPENADLVQRYGPTGSSIWIGVYDKDGNFTKEQNTNIWYKTGDMENCREYVKGVIEEKLRGE